MVRSILAWLSGQKRSGFLGMRLHIRIASIQYQRMKQRTWPGFVVSFLTSSTKYRRGLPEAEQHGVPLQPRPPDRCRGLAGKDPVAAEMAQMRETLEDIRKRVSPRSFIPPTVRADLEALRNVVARNINALDESDFELLSTSDTSPSQESWTIKLRNSATSRQLRSAPVDDPWTTPPASDNAFSDEPPF
jgi:hypothetical protein